MEYSIGQNIITTASSPDDEPKVGDVRAIVDAQTGAKLAWYRVREVIPPTLVGWVAMIHAQICEEPQT